MEIKQYHIHEHPLTLCEYKGDDVCRICGNLYWHQKSYSCNHCNPEKCFACYGKPSGSSFYICKQCGPESPYFHQSCAALPRQIQIALRTHCYFHFAKEESTTSDMSNIAFDCDFCNKSHKGYKFCCDLCNFHICGGCAAVLIKYDQGGDSGEHIQHFTHNHPLALWEVMEMEDPKSCNMCRKDIHGQSYSCAPCNFFIHKSCAELLQEFQHPLHPRGSLTLQNTEGYKICDVCCFDVDVGMHYKCSDVVMHPECVSLMPNIQYQGHQHLLILVENMSCIGLCYACSFKVEGTFFVRCVECDLNFHVQCSPDWLPPIILVEENHNHHLSLITKTLVKDDSFLLYCNICKEVRDPKHPAYGCLECDFYAHLRCIIPKTQLKEPEKVKHFSHDDHFLFPFESKMNDDIECSMCEKSIQAQPAYGCHHCRFYLHKSCFELPEVIYPASHSHSLTLQDFYSSKVDGCKACSQDLNGFVYSCRKCDFNLDVNCALQQLWRGECKYSEDREEIGHYGHRHHLTLSEVGDKECKFCFKNIHGSCHGCTTCMFYIHKSCGDEFKREIRHPFHPRHSLTLQEDTSSYGYLCDACCFRCNPPCMLYRCARCNFNLHPECVSLKPNIRYKYHPHLVILVESMMAYGTWCHACHCRIYNCAFFLRCIECKINFHVHCGPDSLPPTVEHQHHDHPRPLTTETLPINCGVCKEEIRNPEHPSYGCVKCEYYAHVPCLITEMQLNEREMLKHFCHDHILFLDANKKNDDDRIECSACNKLIQAHSAAYGCEQCRIYLHKSCVELPRQMQHLLHRHPLSLGSCSGRCSACEKKLCGFTYKCVKSECGFALDLDCALLQPRVKIEGYEHLLTFFEKLNHTSKCKRFIFSFPADTHKAGCLKCNFILHLWSSRLPQIIEQRSHHHSLALTDNVVDHNYGIQICDVCEEEREQQGCVYYCAECDFIAELDCVISEVVLALQKNRPDVPLRTVNRKTTDEVNNTKRLTLKSMVQSMTSNETKKWQDILQVEGYDSDNDFLHPWKHNPEIAPGFLLEDEDYDNSEVIDVGDYKTIPKLAKVLQILLDKYGDIGVSCMFPQRHSNLRILLMVNLCATVHSMCNTMIWDVGGLAMTWRWYLKLIRQAGFKVDFVFDHLKKIEEARHEIGTETELPQISQIDSLYEEMVKVSKEIDKLDQDTDNQKAKLDMLRKKTQDVISNISYQKLRPAAERLIRAKEIGITKAGILTGLL